MIPYHRHVESIDQLDTAEIKAFSEIVSRVTKRYDNLFGCPFPYSMGIHQRPVPVAFPTEHDSSDDDPNNYAHLHIHFEPPLLRSATVRKFLVGLSSI